MEQEKVVLFVGLIFAFAVGIFVIWGPSNLKRKRRKGHVGGLVNLGNTCFLNTLLQSFSACPHILTWLARNKQSPGLISELYTTLQIINGEHSEIRSDPYAPCEVLRLLKAKWRIAPGEQDAHELFVVIISVLEEEIQKSLLPKTCSLSDALELDVQDEAILKVGSTKSLQRNGVPSTIAAQPSSLRQICSIVLNQHSEVSNLPLLPREVFSEADTARKRLSDMRKTSSVANSITLSVRQREIFSPFNGLLTSSLQCTSCSHKNVVQCNKFDSLSLPLPGNFEHRHTLKDLLDNFVATETVHMTCDNCKRPDIGVKKTMNFGKLPCCLCIHIVRTTWLPNGIASKRSDLVEFPEVLPMEKYMFSQREGGSDAPTDPRRHLYVLQAVVVHRGDINQGHFLTYRRSKYSGSWVLTSDADVLECTRLEAMGALAYMLFYDKYF